ncbi:MAG TPA: thioredoxin family protein [Nitrospirota bacterium]
MISEKSLARIKKSSAQVKRPVRLVLFTTDTNCAACPDALELVRAIKAQKGRMAVELYDMVMDRDKSEQYGVKQVPAIVVQGAENQAVTFYGVAEDLFLEALLNVIQAISDGKAWFPGEVRRALDLLSHDARIRVFVENDCASCLPVAETAIGMALESPKVYTDIVIASDFPELAKKHGVASVPKTVFGEKLYKDGPVSESEFLELIFQSEGEKPRPERRCLSCGNPSPDVICAACKTRIQAEAVEHKLKSEKLKKPETM